MTVADLIAELAKLPPKAEIIIQASERLDITNIRIDQNGDDLVVLWGDYQEMEAGRRHGGPPL